MVRVPRTSRQHIFQAGYAGSIPVSRSNRSPQVRRLAARAPTATMIATNHASAEAPKSADERRLPAHAV